MIQEYPAVAASQTGIGGPGDGRGSAIEFRAADRSLVPDIETALGELPMRFVPGASEDPVDRESRW